MRKYFKHIAQFFLFNIIAYLFILMIWGEIPYSYLGANLFYRQGSYGHLNTRLKEITQYGEVDILFVGSSRVYRGFDPRIFENRGIKVFVLGSSSQTPLQSYVLLKRYLKALNPKLVVFDVLPSSFAIKGIEPSLDLIANDHIDRFNLDLALEQNDVLLWNTLIYAYIRQCLSVHHQFKEPIFKPVDKDTYIAGGYVEKGLTYYHNVNCAKEGVLAWEEPLDIQLEYFSKILNLLNEQQVNIQFVNMPLAHYDCYTNNDQLAKRLLSNYDYIDFNKVLILNDSLDFYDDYHLNKSGVVRLNKYYFDKYLKSNMGSFE